METTKEEETTIISHPTKFTLFVIVFLTTGMGLTMYLFFNTHSLIILFFGVVIFFGYPVVFQKKFRKRFTQTAVISFTADYFSVQFRDPATGEVLRTDTNRFDQIRYFLTANSYRSDFSRLTLYLKDGSKISYTFSGQQGNSPNKKYINRVVKNVITSYNLSKPSKEKITIAASFNTSKASLYFIIGSIVLMVAVLVFIFFLNPGAVPVLAILFFFSSYTMMLTRNKAIEEKNKFS